jgi:hypothetical protein
METIDTYIVRVYRRERREQRRISGLVEIVGSGKKKAFDGGEELLEIMTPKKKRSPPRLQKKRNMAE